MRDWEREGFLTTVSVSPNPLLFYTSLHAAVLQVASVADAQRVAEELDAFDGIISASPRLGYMASLGPVELLRVFFAARDPRSVGRTMRAFRRLAKDGLVDGPYPFAAPKVARTLTEMDWRIIVALRANPTATLSRVAKLVGITLKTLIRRRDALLEAKAIFYHAEFNYPLIPSAKVMLYYRRTQDLAPILRALDDRFRHYLLWPTTDPWYYGQHCRSGLVLRLRVPVRSPDEIREVLTDLGDLPGVLRVLSELEGPDRRYSRWIDRRLASRAEVLPPGQAPARRHSRAMVEGRPVATCEPSRLPAGTAELAAAQDPVPRRLKASAA